MSDLSPQCDPNRTLTSRLPTKLRAYAPGGSDQFSRNSVAGSALA